MNQGRPLAVIDIGSNSSRLVIFQVALGGHVEVLRDARMPLRLAREVQDDGAIGTGAIDRTIHVMRDFRALIQGAGADPVYAVATSAVREATNATEFVERIRYEAGVHIEVIDGDAEARYAFLGAVYGLPVDHGYLIDVGGGSMEVSHIRNRALLRTWTLPLGALRASDGFLVHDPPTEEEVRLLEKHVDAELEAAQIPPLETDEVLVGTGGTVRNLAKIDRARREYPIHRLHGYTLAEPDVAEVRAGLAARNLEKRAATAGLNADRADSIVGGAIVIHRTMRRLGADRVEVSGQGLREGLILHHAFDDQLPPAETVRRASIFALAGRFAGWAPAAASRRSHIALRLLDVATPDMDPAVLESVEHAAHLLEIGRNIDYYNRHEHTADIVEGSDLAGFSHRATALLGAVVRSIGKENLSLRAYRPLLSDDDRPAVLAAGCALALADEIDARIETGSPEARWSRRGKEIVLDAAVTPAWRPRSLGGRFRKIFGARLVLPGDGDGDGPAG